jgi:hypothetical protein
MVQSRSRCFSRSGVVRSSSRLSGTPPTTIRRVWTGAADPARSRGATAVSHRCFISRGTPGSSTMQRPGHWSGSHQMPGAVPREFRSGTAPAGTSACLKLMTGGVRPRLA